MARVPRIMIVVEPTVYHVISRTALDGYPIGDVEKDYVVIRKDQVDSYNGQIHHEGHEDHEGKSLQ